MPITELPKQIRLTCDDCGEDSGSEEVGGYFVYDASDMDAALAAAAFHRLPGNVIVCDNCAWDRKAERARGGAA